MAPVQWFVVNTHCQWLIKILIMSPIVVDISSFFSFFPLSMFFLHFCALFKILTEKLERFFSFFNFFLIQMWQKAYIHRQTLLPFRVSVEDKQLDCFRLQCSLLFIDALRPFDTG